MDFIINKVNGEDLSSATNQKILEVFQTASDPIIVEITRKNPTYSKVTHQSYSSYNMTDLSLNILCSSTDFVNPYANYHNLHSPQPLPKSEHYAQNEPTGNLSASSILPTKQSDNTYNYGELLKGNEIMEEDEDEEQMEIIKEEVTLKKVHPQEIFGLTLSYSALAASDHSESEVYISGIESDSVAYKQTGIKIGDQILQINGIDVHSKAQVVALFQSCGLEVCMLLGRPNITPKRNGFKNSKPRSLNCDLQPVEEVEYSSVYDDVESHKDDSKLKTTLEKDSVIGRVTDETSKTEESSECESSQASQPQSSQFSSLDSAQSQIDFEHVSLLMQNLALEYHQLQRLLLRPQEGSSTRIQTLSPLTSNQSSSRVVPRMGTKLENSQLKMTNIGPTASVSSTGSCGTGVDCTRSSSLTMELKPTLNSASLLSLKLDHLTKCRLRNFLDENYHFSSSSRTKFDSCESTEKKKLNNPGTADFLNSEIVMNNIMTCNIIQDNECHYYDVYDPSTLSLDQDIFNPNISTNIYAEHEYINLSLGKVNRNENKMEWVVKKRPDGTRYITRRPIRNKIQKDRTKKVSEDRAGQTTEEEEMNKYSCKSDKRKHQEKSKEKKHKRKESPSRLYSDISSNSPALSRNDLQSLKKLRDLDSRNMNYQKLYNKSSIIMGTTMF